MKSLVERLFIWNTKNEGQLVEHGDLLSELKRVQEGLLGGFERELEIPNTLLITGSGVRVPHHPLTKVSPEIYSLTPLGLLTLSVDCL